MKLSFPINHLVFHASSAIFTFCRAVTSVNGGTGGRTVLLFAAALKGRLAEQYESHELPCTYRCTSNAR